MGPPGDDAHRNQTDRLLAIILELQDRKHLRAEDLAAIFEVSKRTIYRDFVALELGR
jgi:predicted DNA-binding transcriptional regulator YafY